MRAVSRDPSHEDGWDWLDQTYGVLAFFGKECSRAQGATTPLTVDVVCKDVGDASK